MSIESPRSRRRTFFSLGELRGAMVQGNGVAKRLLLVLVLVSAAVTAVITAGELYLRYVTEMRKIEADFSFISDIYQPALAESVWVLDEKQIVTQLDGLLRLPNVEYIGIEVEGKLRWSAGARKSRSEISRSAPLMYGRGIEHQAIGTLHVVASEDRIIDALWAQLLRTLAANAFKTTLVCAVMLIVFQTMITRHLVHLGRYLRRLPESTEPAPLRFARADGGRWRPDELDQVAQAVNDMMSGLRAEQRRSAALTARLAKSEVLFRSVFNEAGSAIAVIDGATQGVMQANDIACRTLGYDADEMLTLRLPDYAADLDDAHLRELLAHTDHEGMHRHSRHRRKDGRLIDVDESLRGVRIGDHDYVVHVWRDVTEQAAIERELAHTRDELQQMAELVPVVVYRYRLLADGTPQFIYVSPPIQRLLGVTPEQVVADGRGVFARVHPDDVAGLTTADMAAAKLKTPFRYTFRVVPRPGEMRWITAVSEPRDDPEFGTVWYGYLQDVTEQELAAQSLHGAQERFRVAFEASPLAVAISRAADGTIIAMNSNVERMLGWNEDDLLGHAAAESIWPSPEIRADWLQHLQVSGMLLDYQTRWRHKDGRLIDVNTSASLIDIDGERSVITFASDFSEVMRGREAERRAAGVFAHSAEGIVICDADSRIVDVNPAFTQITGYQRDEVVGNTPSMFASGRHDAAFYAEMWRNLKQHDFWRGEIWNRRKNGEVFPEMLSIAAVRSGTGTVEEYIAVFTDISRMKAHEEELHRIAYYDALTGLPNRRLLGDRMQLALARARREGTLLGVCFLDLDGFKPINDQYGHAVGDQLLLGIARALATTLRGGDTLARMGGDEFVLLFGEVRSEAECRTVLQRVLDAARAPVMVEHHRLTVSASIGVTLFPHDDGDADVLLRHADQAMYRAKEQGKNRFHVFDPETDRRLSAHREALQALEGAFERREFLLWYQPKIDLRSGEVVGAEALIRWRQEDGTIVPPGQFLLHMEGESLELAVSEWVIETALGDLAAFRAQGLDVQISANLVSAHLGQLRFIPWLRDLLAEFPDYRRNSFSLEILESAAIGDIDIVARQLEAVRAMGIELALDDFGTGYSSLAYFRRLPVDILKIDQGFVRDMLEDASDHNIVESVIRLAEVFDRRAIAEGVETMDHWKSLLALGCDYGQGYGIAKPMPKERFVPWVREWQQNGELKAFLTLAQSHRPARR